MHIWMGGPHLGWMRPGVLFDVRELQQVAAAPWPVRAVVFFAIVIPLLIAIAIGVASLVSIRRSMGS
jgi:hypothetical protein